MSTCPCRLGVSRRDWTVVEVGLFCPLKADVADSHSRCLLSARCGRLQVGKGIFHVCRLSRCSHVFGLLSAVHMTAGHNVLRGSDPGQKPAFDDAVAQVGCPDRRIDGSALRAVRLPTFTSRRISARSRLRRKRDGFSVALASGHHRPGHPGDLVGECEGGNLGRSPYQ
jgi:hypothetical protein